MAAVRELWSRPGYSSVHEKPCYNIPAAIGSFISAGIAQHGRQSLRMTRNLSFVVVTVSNSGKSPRT
jgi:hypothetical protein